MASARCCRWGILVVMGASFWLAAGCPAPCSNDQAPVADAGPNRSVKTGVQVTLDGRPSYDPDGDTLTYQWAQTAGAEITLNDATTSQPSFVPATDGDYEFTLTVTDPCASSTSIVVRVTASAATGVEYPVADAGSNQTVDPGAVVHLDGSASHDPGSFALTYSWRQVGGTHVTLGNADTVQPQFIAPSSGGSLVFALWVNNGTLDTTDTVTIAVNPPAPVASNQTLTTNANAPLAITLTATTTGTNTLTYTVVTNPSHGTLSGTAPNLTYTPQQNYAGSDSFTFKANDGIHDSNVATIAITVQSSTSVIHSGETVSGCLQTSGQQDTWTISGVQGHRVLIRIATISGSLAPEIDLYQPNAGSLETGAKGDNNRAATIDQLLLMSGDYAIVVKDGFTGTLTGCYRMTMIDLAAPGTSSSDTDGGTITSGQTINGTVGPADLDAFVFSGVAGQHVSIRVATTVGSFWPQIVLYPPGGDVAEASARGDSTSPATLTNWPLALSGSYTIVIGDGYSGLLTGSYSLTFTQTP